ncbi:hypothetical protein HMPREF0591_0461 [Mycobacterium parascrofulaceum ATCC BAA-614]|uniref:Uncharacterized protein n=1 Tax=Mycobacterium parascrofulaceum ATCC BAA-614 TaxID=525368 RepID=D5P2R7_9MYCO|nr:hypothetical protein HMPREF0591_0461 [Mycobacterium parascrofulaceum ATCC BAA-614]
MSGLSGAHWLQRGDFTRPPPIHDSGGAPTLGPAPLHDTCDVNRGPRAPFHTSHCCHFDNRRC